MTAQDSRNKANLKWKKNNPKRLSELSYLHKVRLRKAFFEMYGSKCACPKCNETLERFLTLDHVNNNGYLMSARSKNRGTDSYKEAIAQYRPDKYQVLCYNCNCGKRDNGGICPHLELRTKSVTTVSSLRKRKLTWEQVEEIRENTQHKSIPELAKIYGVSYAVIFRVKHYQLYKKKTSSTLEVHNYEI